MFAPLLHYFRALDTHFGRSSEQKHLFTIVSQINLVYVEYKYVILRPLGDMWFIRLGLHSVNKSHVA